MKLSPTYCVTNINFTDKLDVIPDIPTSNEPASEQPFVSEQYSQMLLPSVPPVDGIIRARSGCTSRPPQRYRLDIGNI